MNNYASISFLRAIAILSVAILHLSTSFLQYSNFYDIDHINAFDGTRALHLSGYKGVYIFFAISAFLITSSIYKLNISTMAGVAFFKKRLFRIYPPYLASLVILLVVHLVLGDYYPLELFKSFSFSLFFSHDIFFRDWSIINPVAWSLEVEVQFYALVAVFITCFSLFLNRKYFALFVISTMSLLIFLWLNQAGNRVIFNYAIYFFAGIFAAISWLNCSKVKFLSNWRGFSEMFFLMSLILVFVFENPVLIAISLYTLVLFGLASTGLEALFSLRVIRYISKVSYSYYLLHYAMFHFFMLIFAKWFSFKSFFVSSSLVIGIFIPMSMIAVYPFYFVFERNHDLKLGFIEYIRCLLKKWAPL